MKGWLASVLGVSLFTVLLNLLLKNTRMQKPVQGVLSVLLSVTFLTPILSLKNGDFNIVTSWEEQGLPVSSEITQIIAEQRKSVIERKIEEKLKEIGGNGYVTVFGEFEREIKIEKVLIKVNLTGISQQKANIVEMRRTVSAYCEIGEEDVTVYANQEKPS